MVKLNITMDNDVLLQLQMALARVGTGSLPFTKYAMKAAAEKIAKDWRDFATGGSLRGIKPLPGPNRSYALGVKIRPLGLLGHEIYNESRAARQIEEGTPELDMKKTHPYGPKSRVSKKGVPFLIIPFRWGVPDTLFRNVMPKQVYNIVRNFKKMETLVRAEESGKRSMNAHRMLPNGRASENGIEHAEMVGRAQYNKGYDRLNIEQIINAEPDVSINQIFNMNGMVRTTDKTGKDRTGGYLTFRVISAKSPAGSWIRPRVEPRHVVDALVELNRGQINKSVEDAVREDLKSL